MEQERFWNPYIAGALVGVLMILSVVIASKYLGASTSFVRTAGMIEQLVASDHVAANEYFQKKTPKIDWQWVFVIGIFLGSLIASKLSRSFKMQSVPTMWEKCFGEGKAKRAFVAFVGGGIMMFGARFAGGCPSGHGLSGVAQLSVGSLISIVCFFVGGIIMAHVLYGKGVRS